MSKVPRLRLEFGPPHEMAAASVARSGCFVSGEESGRFTSGLKDFLRVPDIALVSNGFASLVLTLRALDLQDNKILVPAYSTCFSIPNAVLASGNMPVFCPLDTQTLGLDIEEANTIFEREGFDAVVQVSHFGIPADAEPFRKFGVPVIDDSAQAILTRSLRPSTADATLFSFYPTKHMNAIDGGCVISNEPGIIRKINELSYYDEQSEYDGVPRYNFRFLNFHAAFGLVSLDQAENTRSKLRRLAADYRQLFTDTGMNYFERQFDADVVPYKILVRIPQAGIEKFTAVMTEHEVETARELLPVADRQIASQHSLCAEIFSLPYFEALTQREFEQIKTALIHYAGDKKSNS